MTFKETQRRRFHALSAKIAAVRAAAGPLREARDAFVNQARAKERTLDAEIKAAEQGLAALTAEHVFLARALGAVGEAPEG